MIPLNIVKEYKFELNEFHLLTERLGYQMDDYIIKIDLVEGFLAVRPSREPLMGLLLGFFQKSEILGPEIRIEREYKEIHSYVLQALECARQSSANLDRLLIHYTRSKIPRRTIHPKNNPDPPRPPPTSNYNGKLPGSCLPYHRIRGFPYERALEPTHQ
jgi:hypothetical protein